MRWLVRFGAAAVAVSGAVLLAAYLVLHASLADLDGSQVVDKLSAAVTVERDAFGVVTVTAQTRQDAAFATGFVHAQERYFQMDLQRRAGAGELAALLGAQLVEVDKRLRLHRFRARAQAAFAHLPAATVALYETYTAGVQAGLAGLGARPFEYLLLGAKPQPWQREDVLLTMYSMWFELNDERAQRESQLALLRERLPQPVYDWLIQSGTSWDAPLLGEPIPAAPMPTAQQYDLRTLPREFFGAASPTTARHRNGSNNWAAAGTATADGNAIVAGDMHLGHAVPNIWFRARLSVPTEDLDINGVMLAGTPLIVAGSNSHIAWSYTNSYGDWEDLVLVQTNADDPSLYRTGDGWQRFTIIDEPIVVKDSEPVPFQVVETVWGPVLDRDHRGRLRALHWSAHQPEATNAGIGRLEQVRTVDEAVEAANRIGIPPQNVVIADRSGRIAWTIMGRIPRRVGVDPLLPSAWIDGRGWHGWIAPEDYPRIVDPGGGRLWTANARTVDGAWLRMLGQGDHPPGARASQIRDVLHSSDALALPDMLSLQLDNRAVFLSRWQSLLLDVLDDRAAAAAPDRAAFRGLVREWGARAAVDSAGYRFVRAFRDETVAAVTDAVLAPVRAQVADFRLTRHGQLERPVWQLLTERPAHLLDPRFASWDEFLLAVIDRLIEQYGEHSGGLSARTWGELNTASIAHPMSRALSALSGVLDMPATPLPGDADMPRVQSASFGASQRMAVSPGREHEGYLHMPGGQSGHPLSPFYGAGHQAWIDGEPTPFLPGPTRYRLDLVPGR